MYFSENGFGMIDSISEKEWGLINNILEFLA
jgi:hypothetical protein